MMGWLSGAAGLWSRRIDEDLLRAWRWARDRPFVVVVGLGVVLRIAAYVQNRPFWMDEISLWGNVADTPPFDFSLPLAGHQLAPHGFLITARAMVSLLGTSRLVVRFLPLLAGIAALFLFSRLVRSAFPPRPALVALLLFACSQDLIYYSTEFKPYSFDLAIGLAVTVAALRWLKQPLTTREVALLALAAAAAPWWSFASAFVFAGCGATLFVGFCRAGRRRDALLAGAVGLVWCASFVASYRAAKTLLAANTVMYQFWAFAFLPIWPPPARLDVLRGAVGILLDLFVNPLNLVAPIWPWLGVIPPLLLVWAGAWSLLQRWPTTGSLLVVPIVLAAVASALKFYPLHGRVVLELVPAFFGMAALGTEVVRRWDATRLKVLYTTVLIVLLVYPCGMGFKEAVLPSIRIYHPHGDLHDNMFLTYDYLAHVEPGR